MELEKIKDRHYLINDDHLKKMIPIKYEFIIGRLKLSDFNFEKLHLTQDERFKLELEHLVHDLENREPLVYELIKNKKVNKVSLVQCKHSESRNEVKIGSYWVKCSTKLFALAPAELIINRFSNY